MRYRDLFLRAAGVGALLMAALALTGCGRKGPLDLPPGAAVTAPAGVPPQLGPDGQPIAAVQQPPPKKHFILDPLLD